MKKFFLSALLVLLFPMIWTYNERLGILIGIVPNSVGRPTINLGFGLAILFYILLSFLVTKLLKNDIKNKIFFIVLSLIGGILVAFLNMLSLALLPLPFTPLSLIISDPLMIQYLFR